MAVRAYKLVGASAIAGVQRRMTAAINHWASAWGVDGALLPLRVERCWEAHAATAEPWRQHWRGAGAWCDWDSGIADDIARLAFPPDGAARSAPSALAAGAGAAAFDQLLDMLRKAVAPNSVIEALRAPGQHQSATGSGAVLVTLGEGASIRILFDDACVQRMAGAAQNAAKLEKLPAVDMFATVAAIPVRLQVRAGSAELGAGTLLGIGTGDVIRLDTRIDAPVTLTRSDGVPMLEGYLGRSGNTVAVEIAGLKQV